MKNQISMSVSGLHFAICNKPKELNLWVLKCYDRENDKRTLSQFYTQILFNFANF